jgi:hypothetical protein
VTVANGSLALNLKGGVKPPHPRARSAREKFHIGTLSVGCWALDAITTMHCASSRGDVIFRMFWPAFIVALFFSGTLIFGPAALAQRASLQGNVLGADGRPLHGVEVRIERTDKTDAPTTNVTGSRGQYLFTELPAGLYKLSIVTGGTVKFSVSVKMRGEKARIDFDLSPSAEKRVRNYVWVVGRTGSNIPGRWAERDAGISDPNR